MSKYVCEYKYQNRFNNQQHTWTCIGRHGALHLHITNYKSAGEVQGGLEIHCRTPPDHMRDDAPSHEKCWLLGQPCWHDGTSLYVSETVIPYWLSDPHNHDRMFEFLQHELRERTQQEDGRG